MVPIISEKTQKNMLVFSEPLFSSEVQYFRIPKKNWEKVIDSTIEMGNTCISFYVPWYVHETADGEYDFEGKSFDESDLISWLNLLNKKNVKVILRPGPYIYSEMRNLGLPQWLVEKHSDARIMELVEGKLVYSQHNFAFAHNNPIFFHYVERWLKEVVRICGPYIGNDKMISMVQLCNEIPGVDIDDMNPMTLQLNKNDSSFFQFYESRYKLIDNFNQAYRMNYKSFQDIRPWEICKEKERYKKDHLSYMYEDYYVRYFRNLIQIYENEGIKDLLYLHNAYNPRAISLHLEIRNQIPNLYYGLDNYFSLQSIFDEHSAAYYCEFAPEYAKAAFQHEPFVLEHESGYWLDRPKVYGKDLYLFTIWSYLGGFKGTNLFLGHEGENQKGMGMMATTHKWQAPIRNDGSKKDSYYDIQKAYECIKHDPVIFAGDTVYDVSYSFPFRSGLIWEEISKQSEEMFYYLFKCNLSSQIIDFDHNDCETDKLIYLSDKCMDQIVQEKMLNYVEDGNTLVLCGELPIMDNHLNPCTVLIEKLRINNYLYSKYDCWGQKLILMDGEEILQDSYPLAHISSDKICKRLAKSSDGKDILVKIPYGKGFFYILSGAIQYQMNSQKRLVDMLLKDMGMKTRYKSDLFRIITKKYKGFDYYYLLNPNPFEMEEKIHINGKLIDIKIPAYEFIKI